MINRNEQEKITHTEAKENLQKSYKEKGEHKRN
jgi:hypothetical protein